MDVFGDEPSTLAKQRNLQLSCALAFILRFNALLSRPQLAEDVALRDLSSKGTLNINV